MLESEYEDILYGKSYLSILYGIIKIHKGSKSVLLIDSEDSRMGESWLHNIGEIEKEILINIGDLFNISALKKLDSYLVNESTLILLDDTFIELGNNPYINMRELARKIPGCFTTELLSFFEKQGEEKFNSEIQKIFLHSSEKISDNQPSIDILAADTSMKLLFDRFLDFVNASSDNSKQFHYVLQVLFQTTYSNLKHDKGSRYLLSSILSPRYRIDSKSLSLDLFFEFKNLGGRTKIASIDAFEVYKSKLEYIKLNSLDGIIKLKQLSYFSRINSFDKIRLKYESTIFDTITICSDLSHKNINFYKNKRILVSHRDKLGTDFPHFEIFIHSDNKIYITYSYADILGRKPSFFYSRALNEVVQVLLHLFPGIDSELFKSRASFKSGNDFWQQINSSEKKSFNSSESVVKVFDKEVNVIESLSNFGPFRVQSHGLYSYLYELL